MHRWTPEQAAYLASRWPSHEVRCIAFDLGLSARQVVNKRLRLGIPSHLQVNVCTCRPSKSFGPPSGAWMREWWSKPENKRKMVASKAAFFAQKRIQPHYCRDCRTLLNEANWPLYIRRLRHGYICRDCALARIYKARRRDRLSLINALGGVCNFCGRRGTPFGKGKGLQLAHKVYAPDSAMPQQTWRRLKEARSHPERFYLLCSHCHLVYDLVRKYRGVDIVALQPEKDVEEIMKRLKA